jgi:cytochrome c-type biogenesis protein CcmH/NrfF
VKRTLDPQEENNFRPIEFVKYLPQKQIKKNLLWTIFDFLILVANGKH